MKKFLSLGAGVQSSTLALMVEQGELPPIKAAVFADTGDEPKSVYKWLGYLKSQVSYPVYTVRQGHLSTDALEIKTSKKSGNVYFKQLIPFFIRNGNGSKGIAQRKCTRDYKIYPVRRKIKELCDIKGRLPQEPVASQYMGISTDEAHRMKDSPVPWLENKYPLVELGMSRQDCLKWMQDKGYPEPPRSACSYCPYHSNAEWLRLQTEEPAEFERAVNFERKLWKAAKESTAMRGKPFLHASLVPLDKVSFSNKGTNGWGNECEGMCGL